MSKSLLKSEVIAHGQTEYISIAPLDVVQRNPSSPIMRKLKRQPYCGLYVYVGSDCSTTETKYKIPGELVLFSSRHAFDKICLSNG